MKYVSLDFITKPYYTITNEKYLIVLTLVMAGSLVSHAQRCSNRYTLSFSTDMNPLSQQIEISGNSNTAPVKKHFNFESGIHAYLSKIIKFGVFSSLYFDKTKVDDEYVHNFELGLAPVLRVHFTRRNLSPFVQTSLGINRIWIEQDMEDDSDDFKANFWGRDARFGLGLEYLIKDWISIEMLGNWYGRKYTKTITDDSWFGSATTIKKTLLNNHGFDFKIGLNIWLNASEEDIYFYK